MVYTCGSRIYYILYSPSLVHEDVDDNGVPEGGSETRVRNENNTHHHRSRDAAHKKASRERYGPARGRLCGLREGPVRRVVGRRRRGWWRAAGGGGGGEGRCNGLSSDVWHRYKRRGASSSSERLVVTHYICIYIAALMPPPPPYFIYIRVCVCSVPRTLHRGSGHRVQFLHLIQDYPSVVVRGDRG